MEVDILNYYSKYMIIMLERKLQSEMTENMDNKILKTFKIKRTKLLYILHRKSGDFL